MDLNDSISVEQDGPILEVTVGRGKANAIDAATSKSMGAVFERFRDDPSLRAAILTGAGDRFFSAGWDLNAAVEGEAYESDYGPGGFGGFAELAGLNKPVIVAVNGIAAGGGFEMVLAAHMAVAADHAEFLLPEARRGIVPDVGLIRLPQMLPKAIATEVLMGTRRLSAEEALHFGIVNRVVPATELLDAARELALAVAAAAPLSVAAILDVMDKTRHIGTAEALAMLRDGRVGSYKAAIASYDAAEGVAAFTEKRDPKWRGR